MSKLAKSLIIFLVILVAGGITGILIVLNITDDKSKAQSIEEIAENSFETPEITTDLKDGSFVRIQFQILTNGKNAKKEINNRDFQLKNILIKELAKLNEKDFKEGLTDLEKTIKDKLNELMTDGEITDVYTINKILQ